MNGILLVNKPQGMTSHDVVNIVRRLYHTKKVGHTGTLDPDATGLLILGINDGTKIIKFFNQDEKTYQARIAIGSSTTTLDKTGTVIATKEVTSLEGVDDVLESFKGNYHQTPPMYSAIKYNGKRLYEYAREGITIEDRPSRDVKIIDIKRISDILYKNNHAYFDYLVYGTKGLYVRTLSYDIGAKLGYPAHNYELHRIQAGPFHIKDSYTLDDLKNDIPTPIPLGDALSFLPAIMADETIYDDVRHGRALDRIVEGPVRILDSNSNLLAVYDNHPDKPLLKAINVFIKE
ncbi:tRNA pseudouridine(55) synthase TruB [Candidatus Xianfuyuplasma coldseepsis]|uniref:tRNA pseudouridine synthase B n=1 Tax=Candidatus Xianfuyuplasma coldseepsis TaxID=2782163 RepID=A0A7L7KTD2_9MOLU|nr:tRNA pseudouridine(55) synthase TruB [Xianfuyuplasma coldseepsis]QMS85865.1 tRNA pseudouridine(55) synthase TruB [Xianfuyuplasma coldseepsis]